MKTKPICHIIWVLSVFLIVLMADSVIMNSLLFGQSSSKPVKQHSYEELLLRGKMVVEYRPVSPIFSSPTPFPIIMVNQYPDSSPQNEPSVRMNPTNVDNIVVAYRDFHLGSDPAIRSVGISTTTDGGYSWKEQFATYLNHNRFSDPAVGVDLNGIFYVTTIDWHEDDTSQGGWYTSLRKSPDRGLNWQPSLLVAPYTGSDKDMIWVDDGPMSPYRDNVYIAWQYGTVDFVKSTDKGTTFSPPFDNPEFSCPSLATGPNGELYIVGYTNGLIQWNQKSFDGGDHFINFIHPDDSVHPMRGQVVIGSNMVALCEPVISVDRSESSPRKGTVYVVYASTSHGDGDIFCVSSTDSATTWSPSIRVNNDSVGNGRDQFHFWMTVDDSGFIDVVFLDRRNDPNNLLCDAFFAQSRDGGRSFKNFKITTQNFDPTIYDILGREVAILVQGRKEGGNYSVEWNAYGFGSGVFFYKLEATSESDGRRFTDVKKMVLVK